MKILIVVNNLSGGGAEKVAVDIANHFNTLFNINILTLSDKPDVFRIDKGIKREKLNLRSSSTSKLTAIKKNFLRLFYLRRKIKEVKPDIVISFMNRTNVRVLISLLFSGIPVIVTEHNYPKMNKMNIYWEILRRLFYPLANRLVSVSKGIDDCFTYIPEKKRSVIYNPVTLRFNDSNVVPLDLTKKNIVAIGRLEYIKGFDILVKAFKLTMSEFPDWNLSIVGNGSKENELNSIIGEESDRIKLLGFLDSPHTILSKSDLFVLSSRSEGFGNVIIEAMMCNIPVLSVNCPVGPREIIRNNENGVLVPSENILELSKGLRLLMGNKKLRDKIKAKALKDIYPFSNETVYFKWHKVIMDLHDQVTT